MQKFFLWIFTILFCASAAFAEDKEPIANYQILFSPKDKVDEELISMIGKERKSIQVAIYCLMHRGIAKSLIDAHKRGVSVEIIIDPYSAKARAILKKMHEAMIPIFVWNPPPAKLKNGRSAKKRRSLMHDKFCVFGDKQVWTGSFNFTFEASNSNRENVMILENQDVAARYHEEFERLKKDGCVSLDKYLMQLKP